MFIFSHHLFLRTREAAFTARLRGNICRDILPEKQARRYPLPDKNRLRRKSTRLNSVRPLSTFTTLIGTEKQARRYPLPDKNRLRRKSTRLNSVRPLSTFTTLIGTEKQARRYPLPDKNCLRRKSTRLNSVQPLSTFTTYALNRYREASKTRSVRNAVKECTQTYTTEQTRKRDNVLRSLYVPII